MEVVRLQKKGKETLKDVKSSVDELAQKTGQAVTAALGSEPAKAIARVVDEGLSHAGEWVEEAESRLGKAAKKVSAAIKKHPFEAIAIGFGLGALIAAVLKPRRN